MPIQECEKGDIKKHSVKGKRRLENEHDVEGLVGGYRITKERIAWI
jgi:hypothetical protein